MSYVRQSLIPGEKIVDHAIIHWGIFIVPVLLIVGALLVPAVLAIAGSDPTLWICCLGIGILPGVITLLTNAATFISSEMAVTDRRVIGKRGMISRHSLELPLAKIESVDAQQSIMGRMLNYGTIIVSGSGTSRMAFPGIEDPMTFRQRINAAMAAAK